MPVIKTNVSFSQKKGRVDARLGRMCGAGYPPPRTTLSRCRNRARKLVCLSLQTLSCWGSLSLSQGSSTDHCPSPSPLCEQKAVLGERLLPRFPWDGPPHSGIEHRGCSRCRAETFPRLGFRSKPSPRLSASVTRSLCWSKINFLFQKRYFLSFSRATAPGNSISVS